MQFKMRGIARLNLRYRLGWVRFRVKTKSDMLCLGSELGSNTMKPNTVGWGVG